MKRPWMPLYVGDYLAKTGHLSTMQHGAYLLLIMHYWANGKLPQNETKLAAIAKLTEQQWQNNCSTIADFFDREWRHERIEMELTRAKNISQQRSLAGLKSAYSRREKFSTIAEQMPTHSQSHIESLARLSEMAKKK